MESVVSKVGEITNNSLKVARISKIFNAGYDKMISSFIEIDSLTKKLFSQESYCFSHRELTSLRDPPKIVLISRSY